MRVFIAVEFDDYTKRALAKTQNNIRKYSKTGNFTLKENLHMTMKFLGEVDRDSLGPIQDALEETTSSIEPFTLTLDSMGRFVRQAKSLIWLGTSDNTNKLISSYKLLDENLSSLGFPKDKRKFTPHVTLARTVELNLPFAKLKEIIALEPIPIYIDGFVLFKSERIGGRLIYTPIHRTNFSAGPAK